MGQSLRVGMLLRDSWSSRQSSDRSLPTKEHKPSPTLVAWSNPLGIEAKQPMRARELHQRPILFDRAHARRRAAGRGRTRSSSSSSSTPNFVS